MLRINLSINWFVTKITSAYIFDDWYWMFPYVANGISLNSSKSNLGFKGDKPFFAWDDIMIAACSTQSGSEEFVVKSYWKWFCQCPSSIMLQSKVCPKYSSPSASSLHWKLNDHASRTNIKQLIFDFRRLFNFICPLRFCNLVIDITNNKWIHQQQNFYKRQHKGAQPPIRLLSSPIKTIEDHKEARSSDSHKDNEPGHPAGPAR